MLFLDPRLVRSTTVDVVPRPKLANVVDKGYEVLVLLQQSLCPRPRCTCQEDCYMGISIKMGGYPIAGWFVRENPCINGWFGV